VEETEVPVSALRDHAILIGVGRVGGRILDSLMAQKTPVFVIDEKEEKLDKLRQRGIEAVSGNAVALLAAANTRQAKALLVAIPDGFEAGQIVAQGRALNSAIYIIARAHSDAEVEHLRHHGADVTILGEEEIADAMFAALARPR
jgi:CPA2 family monovalent cation:H+ antiporter-2